MMFLASTSIWPVLTTPHFESEVSIYEAKLETLMIREGQGCVISSTTPGLLLIYTLRR
jgi:hypothetical protein